jgi:hypothetical protein
VSAVDWDAVIATLRAGWQQGSYGAYESESGAVCLRGAICRVSGIDVGYLNQEVERPLLDSILVEQFPDRLTSRGHPWIPGFNDHKDTTLDDVILLCEKARAKSGELA